MATAAQTWDIPITGGKRWVIRFLPSLTDLAFLLPAFILFALLGGSKTLLNDSDTGWHLRVGEWILHHKAIPTVDFFSFTKANQPWFAWEWGWDLLFGAIHSDVGTARRRTRQRANSLLCLGASLPVDTPILWQRDSVTAIHGNRYFWLDDSLASAAPSALMGVFSCLCSSTTLCRAGQN